jgi:hypothetical protein
MLRTAFDKGVQDRSARIAVATLGGGEAKTLDFDGRAGSQSQLPPCAGRKAGDRSHAICLGKMASGAFHAETKPFRQTYRCATFASLATQVQHADGPVVEEELTRPSPARNRLDQGRSLHADASRTGSDRCGTTAFIRAERVAAALARHIDRSS